MQQHELANEMFNNNNIEYHDFLESIAANTEVTEPRGPIG